jgi:single-stranded-DNA-specific exonuclease
MPKHWRILPHDPERIVALERAAGVSSVVAQLLLCRGISDPRRAKEFLHPKLSHLRDPDELPGCRQAAQLLYEQVQHKRRIVIYGDYDVDGVSGTALLLRCLKLLGGNVSYHVPNRLSDGYGLHETALAGLAQQGAQCVVTVDCGSTAVAQAQAARELGLTLIITDHHELCAELPSAAAIVHPRLTAARDAGSRRPYPFPELSGAGVAFKLAWALCQEASGGTKVGDRLRSFLVQAIVLAALGTVADVVPLVDENRVLARYGLIGLRKEPLAGLRMLLEVMKLQDKAELAAEDIAFGIAPRLNAAGRLGQARLAVELLTTESEPRARELAQYLDGLNGTRKTLERSIYLAACKQADTRHDEPALVLADRGWHVGVIGIVAGKLAEKYHKPVVLISLDALGGKPSAGSARGIPGFNVHTALSRCGQYLVGYGGHAAAGGLRIEESHLEAFRAAFCEHAAGEIHPAQRTPEITIDAEAPLSAFTLQTVRQMEQLAPFGAANSRPVLCTTGVQLAAPPKKMGGGERHLALHLAQHGVRMRSVFFGGGDCAAELEQAGGHLALAFKPSINTFAGRHNVELEIVDWKPASELASARHRS